jgi:hypothetical protein
MTATQERSAQRDAWHSSKDYYKEMYVSRVCLSCVCTCIVTGPVTLAETRYVSLIGLIIDIIRLGGLYWKRPVVPHTSRCIYANYLILDRYVIFNQAIAHQILL